jgi:hypothetical protein
MFLRRVSAATASHHQGAQDAITDITVQYSVLSALGGCIADTVFTLNSGQFYCLELCCTVIWWSTLPQLSYSVNDATTKCWYNVTLDSDVSLIATSLPGDGWLKQPKRVGACSWILCVPYRSLRKTLWRNQQIHFSYTFCLLIIPLQGVQYWFIHQ